MRAITVSRPGSLPGLSRSHRVSSSSGVVFGPALSPSGLARPRQNSTCALSGWRVRSPTQSRCALVSYHRPEVESTRVIACSKPSSSASCEVYSVVRLISGVLTSVTPQASMNASASVIRFAMSR